MSVKTVLATYELVSLSSGIEPVPANQANPSNFAQHKEMSVAVVLTIC
jgi:hypothetical protein